MKSNDWKERLNVVYSTNPDIGTETDDDEHAETIEPAKQNLRVQLDKKNRGGKVVTLVTGFIGTEDELKELGKLLKTKMRCRRLPPKMGRLLYRGDFKQKCSNY